MNLYALPDVAADASCRIGRGYIPSCCLSVSSASQNLDNALSFLHTAISDNVQSIESGDGLPVSRTVIGMYPSRPPKNEFSEDDFISEAYVENLTQKETEHLNSAVENMETSIIIGSSFQTALTEFGTKFLNGEIDSTSTAKAVIAATP